MKKGKLLLVVGIGCLALIVAALPFMAACAPPAPPLAPPPAPPPAPLPAPPPAPPPKEILWRLNSWMPPPLTASGQLQFACDEIYKRSDGRLKIEIFPLFSLGLSPTTWLRDMKDGAIDISIVYNGYIGGEEPSFTVSEMPYIWESRAQSLMVIDALFPFKKRVYKEVWNSELIATGTIPSEVTYLATTGKRLRTLDDVKGLKVRVWGARDEQVWSRLGVAPQAMPLGEAYMALKTGVVDGVTTGADAFYLTKLYEVLDYAVTVPPERSNCQDIVISKKAWEALPDDLKQIVRDVFVHWAIISKGRTGQSVVDDRYWRKKCEVEGNMIFSELPEEDMDKISEVAWEVLLDWVDKTGGRTLEVWALIKPILIPPTEAGVPQNYFDQYRETLERGR